MQTIIIHRGRGRIGIEGIEVKLASIIRYRFESIVAGFGDVDISFPYKTEMIVDTCGPDTNIDIGRIACLNRRKRIEVRKHIPVTLVEPVVEPVKPGGHSDLVTEARLTAAILPAIAFLVIVHGAVLAGFLAALRLGRETSTANRCC